MRTAVPALVLLPVLVVLCVVWYCCKLRRLRRRHSSASNAQVLLAHTIEGEFSDPILNQTVDSQTSQYSPGECHSNDHPVVGASYYPPGSHPYPNVVYRNPTVYPAGATPYPPPQQHPYPSVTYSYSSLNSVESSGYPDASSYFVANLFPPSHNPSDQHSHQYVEENRQDSLDRHPDKADQFGTTQHAEASYHQSYSPEPPARPHDSAQASDQSDATPQHCRAHELQPLQHSIQTSEIPCRQIPPTASSNLTHEYPTYSNKQEADGKANEIESQNSIMTEDNQRDFSSKPPEKSPSSTSAMKRTYESPARSSGDSPRKHSQALTFKCASERPTGSMFPSSKTTGSLFPTSSNTGSLYRPRTTSGGSYKSPTNLTTQATHGTILSPSTESSSTSESLP